jgi:hypothetical protein
MRVPVFHVKSNVVASLFPASNLRKRAKRVSKVHRSNAIHHAFEYMNKHAPLVNEIVTCHYLFFPSLPPSSPL